MRRSLGKRFVLVVVLAACRVQDPVAPAEDTVASRLEEGQALRRAGRYDEALVLYEGLRRELETTVDRHSTWQARHGWADVQLIRGNYAEALAELPALRALAAGDLRLESRTAYLSAALLHRRGDLTAALTQAELCIDKAREAADEQLELDGMAMLATVHSLSGRHRQALEIDEAIVSRLRRTSPASRALGEQLNELGIDYRRLGRYGDAVRAYEEALALHSRWGNERWEAVTLYNLANVVADRGELERALELKLASLEIARRREDSYGLGLVHADLGVYYLQLGDEARAREHASRALEINRQSQQSMGEISSMTVLAQIELEGGRAGLAERGLRQAARLAEESGYGGWWVATRTALALCLVELGEEEEALELAQTALARAREQGDLRLEIEAMEARARALEARRRSDAAATFLDAIDLLESWRGRLALGDLGLGIAEPRWGIYEGAIRTLLAAGRTTEAFVVSERARARFLLELMAERDTGLPASSDWSAVAAELRILHAERDAAAAARGPEIDREIERRIEMLEALQRDPAQIAARLPEPLSHEQIVARLVREGRSVLSFFWGEEDIYGFRLAADGVRAVRLGGVDELGPGLEFLRSLLQDPEARIDWRPAATRMYERLLAPLGPLRDEQLLVIPDGPLALVPFEVLLPDAKSLPLGLTRAVVYGPSASVLASLAPSARSASATSSMLALGFGGEKPWPWARLLPGDRRSADAPWLPHAEPEAREVVALFGAGSLALTGRGATLEEWLEQEPERRRYLHFATHAVVSPRHVEETHLALRDGRLDLRTIRGLELGADLVALSGCETALGRDVRGEGIVGLSHAFLGAGARSVVVSQWQVDDRASRQFMLYFYSRLLAGESVAVALRRTRERLWADGASRPFQWAPFVAVGAAWLTVEDPRTVGPGLAASITEDAKRLEELDRTE